MYLVMVSDVQSAGKIGDSDIYRITMTTFINLRGPSPEDEKISDVRYTCDLLLFCRHLWYATGVLKYLTVFHKRLKRS